jgi:hypothetical protein
MNMVMVFLLVYGGANNSRCLDNTDQMGEGWSDWYALMMQLKPGTLEQQKRYWNFCFFTS